MHISKSFRNLQKGFSFSQRRTVFKYLRIKKIENASGKEGHQMDPSERLANAKRQFGEYGGVNKSIEASTTFRVMDPHVMPKLFSGEIEIAKDEEVGQKGCYLYGRHFNPTGKELAAIEGTEAGYTTSSGMAAISSTLIQLCKSGDHIVASREIYGGTFAFLRDFLPEKCGVQTTFVNPSKPEEFENAIQPNTKVFYTEMLSNPLLHIADIPKLSEIAKKRNITLVVDNTFSPMIFSPAMMGADIVVHSLTKFINGASDIIGGCVCGREDFIRKMMDLNYGSLMLLGPTMDPQIAFQISMRLPHLGMRIKEHSKRALYIARKLSNVKGIKVSYPGLQTHPQHELFKKLMNENYGFGGMITLDVGDKEIAMQLLENLQNEQEFGYCAVSLGYFDTLFSIPGSSTSSEMGEVDLKKSGISPGLIRMSIGYTGTVEQRWLQLKNGLESVGFKIE